MKVGVDAAIEEFQTVLNRLREQSELITEAGKTIVAALRDGRKLLTCGNGGSAAEALHLSEELIGRYSRDRRALPSVCLNADVTALTCIANDYGYDQIFSRAVEGLGQAGDVFVGFSSSGNSENVLRGQQAARARDLTTILLLGKDGGRSKGTADIEVIVPSDNTARVQESHTFILHQWLEQIDAEDWD